MTNLEKFKEVFGHTPVRNSGIFDCPDCPNSDECEIYRRNERYWECTVASWWDEEYKEVYDD